MAAAQQRQTGSGGTAKAPDDNATISDAELWDMVGALRGVMDTAEYKHVVLGLVFLKYVSDTYEEARLQLALQGADPADPNRYRAQNILWVPQEGRWSSIMAQARQPAIGHVIDSAISTIERENPAIQGIFPKNYARPSLDKARLGRIVDLIGNIQAGDGEPIPKDILGRVYGYFLPRFVSAEGKKGGEFYTPPSVARLLVQMLRPCSGRVYDPCCGSASMLVQSVEFARSIRNGNRGQAVAGISVYGQETDHTAWQLAKMNLAVHGIDAGHIIRGDSLCNDQHPDLKADYILANPPFSAPEWGGNILQDDRRWKYGIPPEGNANFAWVQHILHHLAPSGTAGFVLANGSMSSMRAGEGEIRKRLVDENLVDCIVALPGQLFYSSHIPACLWFLSKNRAGRQRRGEVLFIDARRMGQMADKTHRGLTGDEIGTISGTYRAWRGGQKTGRYADVPGFCRSAKPEEIRKNGHVLAPGRYVGAEPQQDGGEPFKQKMSRLVERWGVQQEEAKKLDAAIMESMKKLGFNVGGGKP